MYWRHTGGYKCPYQIGLPVAETSWVQISQSWLQKAEAPHGCFWSTFFGTHHEGLRPPGGPGPPAAGQLLSSCPKGNILGAWISPPLRLGHWKQKKAKNLRKPQLWLVLREAKAAISVPYNRQAVTTHFFRAGKKSTLSSMLRLFMPFCSDAVNSLPKQSSRCSTWVSAALLPRVMSSPFPSPWGLNSCPRRKEETIGLTNSQLLQLLRQVLSLTLYTCSWHIALVLRNLKIQHFKTHWGKGTVPAVSAFLFIRKFLGHQVIF